MPISRRNFSKVRSRHSVTPEALLAHLDRSGLSRYDMPEYYLALDDIPLTASGKILKRDIAGQIIEGRIVPSPIRFVVGAPASV